MTKLPLLIINKEKVIKELFHTSVDWFPCLIEPYTVNKFITAERIGMATLLSENVFECGITSQGGWGYDTKILWVKFNKPVHEVTEMELFLPNDFFEKFGDFNSIKDNILYEQIAESTKEAHLEGIINQINCLLSNTKQKEHE